MSILEHAIVESFHVVCVLQRQELSYSSLVPLHLRAHLQKQTLQNLYVRATLARDVDARVTCLLANFTAQVVAGVLKQLLHNLLVLVHDSDG